MLRTLRIRNLVIVEDVTVEFAPGLNLLTGETGAGKSILVDALALVSGARADRSAVRDGATRARVEASFEVGAAGTLPAWLGERGLPEPEEGLVVIQREVAVSSAGRVWVNGSPCALSVLRDLGERLLELHGQHEQHGLLRAARHLELLDGFGGHREALDAVEGVFEAVRAARARLETLVARRERRAHRESELRQLVQQIEALGPRPGEMAELDRERHVLQSAGRIAELLERVVELTYEGERTAASLAAAAASGAEQLAAIDPSLEGLAERCRAAAVELEDVGSGFRDYRERTDFDPGRLEQIESRRASLQQLCLRHATDEAGLSRQRDEAATELEQLGDLEGAIEAARAAVREAESQYAVLARRLTAARRKAARTLGRAVEAQLAELALPAARFEVALQAASGETVDAGSGAVVLGPTGAEKAELRLAANPGEPLRPLQQVASGGELSRVMLALHGVADPDPGGRSVVFDEIDAGVSGAVADAVGARLARLAQRRQVLCVTHLPQVAAHADAHYRVSKRVASGRTSATVTSLLGDGRVEELARMLAGRRPTATSRDHAAALLAAAERGGAAKARRRA